MKIHHLNCGSMREIDPGDQGPATPAHAVNHCLLVETEVSGLVLVETGFGMVDVEQPLVSLGATFLERTQADPRLEQTAVAQIAHLGFSPADIGHIVLTHLDLDHSGGLPDFPDAVVHVHDSEYRSAMATVSPHPEHTLRYRPAHWAHRPRWQTYPSRADRDWFGFDAIELEGLPEDILLVPLAGHTAGHCAVAVRGEDGWLLHAGDAYYHRGEIDPDERYSIAPWERLESITETDRPLRVANHARLRELLRDHSDEVQIFSAHDPWAYQKYAG